MTTPVFDFDLRLARADREGYYHTRWDQAQRITVRAENKQAAVNKAAAALGSPGSGRYWTALCDQIREVQVPDA